MATLQDRSDELPPEKRREVEDFVEFLLAREEQQQEQRLKLGWAGALKAYRGQYTSLELQEKALEWRGD